MNEGKSLKNGSHELKNQFQFSDSSLESINKILTFYPADRKQSALLPLLALAQKDNSGWLSESAIECVAKKLDMATIRVYEVATFYTMFSLSPIGKNCIAVCGTIPCSLCGSETILDVCKKELSIDINGTTKDGQFTLKEVECLGACVNAPVVKINKDYFEDIVPDHMREIINQLREDKAISPGSQLKRQGSAPLDYKKEIS